MANFLGFKQVSLESYNAKSAEEKKNYLWLVRDFSGGTVVSSAIYFGTRKYAEVNSVDETLTEKVENIVNALGSSVDEDGNWLGFLPIEDHAIIGEAENVTEALELLEETVIANKADLERQIRNIESGSTEIVEEIEKIEDKIEEVIKAVETDEKVISTALNDLEDRKIDADKVYTKEETYNREQIDSKISSVFRFKGKKNSVAELPSDAQIGDVWQVGEDEYAWNGTEWVKLGPLVDLSAFATKDYVNSAVTEIKEIISGIDEDLTTTMSALTKEISDREKAVADLESKATLTAQTYDDAIATEMTLGQIIYIKESEPGESGHTAGAYICIGKDGDLTLIQKLEASSGTGETPIERIEKLEEKIGNAELPEDKSISTLIVEMYNSHEITGDDVEEE